MNEACLCLKPTDFYSMCNNALRQATIQIKLTTNKPDKYPAIATVFVEYINWNRSITPVLTTVNYETRDLKKFYYSKVSKKIPHFSKGLYLIKSEEDMSNIFKELINRYKRLSDTYGYDIHTKALFESTITRTRKLFITTYDCSNLLVSIYIRNYVSPSDDSAIVSIPILIVLTYRTVIDYISSLKSLNNSHKSKKKETFENYINSMFGIVRPTPKQKVNDKYGPKAGLEEYLKAVADARALLKNDNNGG